MTVLRLSHVGICVSDLSRSIVFYRDAFGFEEVSQFAVSGPEAARLLEIPEVSVQAVYLQRDGVRIELLSYPVPGVRSRDGRRPLNEVGLTHLSFRVSNFDQIVAKVEALGGTCLEHTRVDVPQHQSKSIFVLDPDGMSIELLELPYDKDWLPGARSAATPSQGE